MSTTPDPATETPPRPTALKRQTLPARVIQALGFNQRFFWTTFWLLLGFVVLLIPLFATKRILFAPALLWSFAYLMVGALFGFIFGVPTIISGGATNPVVNADPTAAAAANRKIVQANTNLTQISDWLTKVIVGAGLVELSNVPDFIRSVAARMAKGIQITSLPAHVDYATVFSGGIIILFTVYGFVFGYLIMRIVLTEIFAADPE